MLLRSLSFTFALGLATALVALDARDARACGGCMHPPPGPTEVDGTVVTDHRMVFSISTTQTVLWDQIRYSGSPKDFAWVLPVKPGTRLELSHDEWIAALDASTQTVIQGPSASCYSSPPTEYDGPGQGGCGFGASSSDNAAFAGGAAADAGALVEDASSQVTVVSEEVVGPYDAVTVRSSQGEALGDWLRNNGYDVPLSIQPTIDAFTNSGFDFIALRLAPGEGVQAMQPVRVITAGADPYLPLRMVAAGVGANVGLELYVLSEGRYHPQNFPDATVDFSQLAWDPNAGRSNYTQLEAAALAANGGRGWVTQYSGPANLYSGGGLTPALSTTYDSTCRAIVLPPPPGCGTPATEAGAPATEAGSPTEAGSEGGEAGPVALDAGEADGDAGATPLPDAGPAFDSGPAPDAGSNSGSCQPTVVQCDDLTLAMSGISFGNLWITRLRASLPAAALSADLILEAAPSQDLVTNVHSTSTYTIANYNPCANTNGATGSGSSGSSGNSGGCACKTEDSPHAHYADAILASLGFIALAGIARRRRRVTVSSL
jgi:MYXO-CTERM domain-containing protein